MKVFNLQCSAHHVFEGWFGSEEDYASQGERGLLECPLCGDKMVHKLPSAPRLNFGAPEAPVAPAKPEKQELIAGGEVQALQAAYLQLARRIVARPKTWANAFPKRRARSTMARARSAASAARPRPSRRAS